MSSEEIAVIRRSCLSSDKTDFFRLDDLRDDWLGFDVTVEIGRADFI